MSSTGKRLKVTVCGEGNASHVMIGQIGSNRDKVDLRVLGMQKGPEFIKCLSNPQSKGIRVLDQDGTELCCGSPDHITVNPEEVIPDSDLILIPLPVFAHRAYFQAISPHLKTGAMVGVLPGQGGSQWLAADIFKEKLGDLVFFGTDRLPYNCRIREFGESVTLYGLKKQVNIASIPAEASKDVASAISTAFSGFVSGNPIGDLLSVTLMPVNQCIHPSRMYSLFHDWDGKEQFKRNPLFYEEMSDLATNTMLGVDKEIQQVVAELRRKVPKFADLQVPEIKDMLVSWYEPELIKDSSTLLNYFRTNKGYAGINTPMITVENGFVPDYKSRYFFEDVPFGLCVLKGIAELVKIPTPTIDMLICWAQGKMGKEFVVQNKLCGKDVKETHAPQAFGFQTIEEFSSLKTK
jgi:hypothetical protein